MTSDESPLGAGSEVDLESEFGEFFAAHHDGILRTLTATIGNDHDAAVDATQDAFIKAHARWSTVRTYDKPEAWVRRIAINTSRDQRRSERRRRDREVSVDLASAVTDAAGAEQLEADDAVREILDELPSRQRQIASMFYVDDRSVEEIAEALGISAGTVKSQLSEARDRLRQSRR